jgi:hypothetical protein
VFVVRCISTRSGIDVTNETVDVETSRVIDAAAQSERAETGAVRQSWLTRMLMRPLDTQSESHSSLLADKDTVYELQCNYYRCVFLNILSALGYRPTGDTLIG